MKVEWENVVGISAILNFLGFTGFRFVESDGSFRPYILATDPLTQSSLSFWIDTPNIQILRSICESRKKFGYKVIE